VNTGPVFESAAPVIVTWALWRPPGAGAFPVLKQGLTRIRLASLLATLASVALPDRAVADEAGVSFWLPGQYGSFAATPGQPGWAFDTTFYHATAAASAERTFARGGGIQTGVKSPSDYVMWTPTYVFATPVLGGQAAVGMTALLGRNTTSVSATLTGPGGASLSGSRSDEVFGPGDLYPAATLKWNSGVHNVMVYATTGIPVGIYDVNRLAAMGIGHWAADTGAGYTYYDEKTGFEWSAIVGFTYNFINPATQYQNGIDAHLDWAISPYVGDTLQLGAVGYFYNQVTGDRGPGATLGDFRSRVAGIGPQVGFFFPVGDREGYLNLRAYYEFDAKNRLEGWTAFISFSVEAPEQKGSRAMPAHRTASSLPR